MARPMYPVFSSSWLSRYLHEKGNAAAKQQERYWLRLFYFFIVVIEGGCHITLA